MLISPSSRFKNDTHRLLRPGLAWHFTRFQCLFAWPTSAIVNASFICEHSRARINLLVRAAEKARHGADRVGDEGCESQDSCWRRHWCYRVRRTVRRSPRRERRSRGRCQWRREIPGESTGQKALKRLLEAGQIQRVGKGTGGPRNADPYRCWLTVSRI